MVKFNISKDLVRSAAKKHLSESSKKELVEVFGWIKKQLEKIPSEKDQQKWIKDGMEWFLRDTKLKVKHKKEERDVGVEHEYIKQIYTFKLKHLPYVSNEDDIYMEVTNWPLIGRMFINLSHKDKGADLWLSFGYGSKNRFAVAACFEEAIKKMESWIEGGGVC